MNCEIAKVCVEGEGFFDEISPKLLVMGLQTFKIRSLMSLYKFVTIDSFYFSTGAWRLLFVTQSSSHCFCLTS
jgi:hypothetical protein